MNKRLVFAMAAVFAATLIGVIAQQQDKTFKDMKEWMDYVKTRLDALKTAATAKDEDDWYTRNAKQASMAHQDAARQVNATYGAMVVQ